MVLAYENNPRLKYPDQYVTVYITEDGKKTELIKEVPIDIAGGGMPEFKETSKPSIALLITSFGDSGAFFSRTYFIDITTRKVLSVNNTNGPTLEVTDTNGQVSKIELSINDTCGTGESRKDGSSATLKDIIVNDRATGALKQTRTLTCVNPGGIGAIYEPSPVFDFMGVSNDLTKVYFSLSGSSYKNGQEQILWKSDFSFDVKSKAVKDEKPDKLL